MERVLSLSGINDMIAAFKVPVVVFFVKVSHQAELGLVFPGEVVLYFDFCVNRTVRMLSGYPGRENVYP